VVTVSQENGKNATMTKKKGERLMEEVEQNYSEAAKRVEEERMN